jgi:hypothetical protein
LRRRCRRRRWRVGLGGGFHGGRFLLGWLGHWIGFAGGKRGFDASGDRRGKRSRDVQLFFPFVLVLY